MSELQDILAERKTQHGDFRHHAQITQKLKLAMACSENSNWSALSDVQHEALEMIVHKIGRILAGDPNHIDHWDDLAGYATLVANGLRSGGGGGQYEKTHQRPGNEAGGASGE